MPAWWNLRSPRYWLVVAAAAPVGLLLGALLTTQFAQSPHDPVPRGALPAGAGQTAAVETGASPGAGSASTVQARNAAFVRAVYHDTVGAGPSQDALDGWLRSLAGGASREQVAAAILASPEYGAALEEQAFRRLLGRSSDGATDWEAALKRGAPPEQLEAGLLGSAEYRQHVGDSDRAWIVAVFRELLGRDPVPAEVDSQLAALAGSGGRTEIAYAITFSDEYRRHFLDQVFQQYLGRAPSDDEVRWLMSAIAAGQTSNAVRAALLGSDEYLRRHAPA